LVFWQSHSADEPPDRLLLIASDVGTNDFDYTAGEITATAPGSSQGFPVISAFALYLQGQEDAWNSLSGTLTTAVAGLSQACNFPLPPYAKSGSCTVADFDEQGQIVFEPFAFGEPSSRRLTIGIPRQTVKGLWLNITEVQPVPFVLTGNRSSAGTLLSRVRSLAAPRGVRGR
jgi:hypothetical protein